MKEITYAVFRLDNRVLTLVSKERSKEDALVIINKYGGGEFVILELYS